MADLAANKKVARAYLELIGKGDADAVANLFADDGAIILQSETPLPPETKGRENIRALIGQLTPLFPETGLKIIVDEMTAEEDRVAIMAHGDAIHASGKPYRNKYHFLLTFRNGKIVKSYEYMDSLLMTKVFFGDAK